jgi:hypothetical protein
MPNPTPDNFATHEQYVIATAHAALTDPDQHQEVND